MCWGEGPTIVECDLTQLRRDLGLFDFLSQLELHGFPSPLTRLIWLDSETRLSSFLRRFGPSEKTLVAMKVVNSAVKDNKQVTYLCMVTCRIVRWFRFGAVSMKPGFQSSTGSV